MINVLVTGGNGLLGQNLLFTKPEGIDVIASDIQPDVLQKKFSVKYKSLDITDFNAVRDVIKKVQPRYIINAAAYTNVDGAEKEQERCWQINVNGVRNLAKAANISNSKIVHVSTDYIFDGKSGPYGEDATPNPLGFYAKSKLAAEDVLKESNTDFAIVRTMVLYGVGVNIAPNFATWLAGALKEGQKVRIVDDQIGNTTLASELAEGIWKIVQSGKMGIYNIANPGVITRYEFALKLAEIFKLDSALISRIKTVEFKQPAPRPLNSGLITAKAVKELELSLSSFQEALQKFKKQYFEFQS